MGRKGGEQKSELKRGRLPIFILSKWGGARVLVDTGSTSTIVGKGVADRMGWLKEAKGCSCRMTTVTGSQKMLGELELELAALTGIKGALIVHIAEIPERTYDIILGTDILRPYKGYPRYARGHWLIKIGARSFRADGCAGVQDQLGVTLVAEERGHELLGKERELVERFEEVMYREGERLSATGRVEHGIELIGNQPVYVKPRRYPQAYEKIMKEHIREMLDTGVIRPSTSPFCSPLWVVPKPPDADGHPRY